MKRFENVHMEGLRNTMTEKELDSKLESAGQLQVRQLLQTMPEESLSLTWRSSLNEKLMASVETRRRKRRVAWFLSPALGIGLASVFAVVFLVKPNVTPEPAQSSSSSLEAKLVASHQDSVRYGEVTGAGLNQDEVIDGKSVTSVSTDYGEVDLGSL